MQGNAGRWAIFIVRRLAGAALAMFGVVVLVFAVSHVLGDPAQLILGPRASAQQLAQLRHQLGYDRSLPAQFWS
jgi:peptide/nickel transport system permease protein